MDADKLRELIEDDDLGLAPEECDKEDQGVTPPVEDCTVCGGTGLMNALIHGMTVQVMCGVCTGTGEAQEEG